MEEFEDNKNKVNIKNVKSPFILRIIFSFLFQKQKLNMIKYNKELQKIFLVDIKDYKTISRKCKIIEKNGKGNEYFIKGNILIFEGEYLNKKRNGKGKEYKNNKIIFEGEYLNGKRIGMGKEYNEFGKVIFEGEYFYNNRKKGRKYYDLGGKSGFDLLFSFFEKKQKLEFEGEFKFDKKWYGKGYDEQYNLIFKWKKKWKRKRI